MWNENIVHRPGPKPAASASRMNRSRSPLRPGSYATQREWEEKIRRAPAASRICAAPSRPVRMCDAS